MKVIATVQVTLEREDGTTTSVAHTHVHSAGDNPSFEVEEAAEAVHTAVLEVQRRVRPRA